jgi:predicted AAA+ superfamily ATPase
MQRNIIAQLTAWKNSEYRKPLVLQGARQVGKTYAVLGFAREQYDNVAYANFEFDKAAAEIFENSLDPKEVVPKI